MADIKPIAPTPQAVGATRAVEAPPTEPEPGIGGRYADTFSLSRVRAVAGQAAETGGRWLSQPIQELTSLVRRVSEFFFYGALRAMARQDQARRDEDERASRAAEAEQARRAAVTARARAEDARRAG
jgi:hypothetical protein